MVLITVSLLRRSATMRTTLQPEILFENNAIIISWNLKERFLHIEWKGYVNNQGYREILDKQLEFTKLKKATKVLYDLRKMGIVSTENQKYTTEVYFPEMAKAGSKYAAVIVPENVFGELSVNNLIGAQNKSLFVAGLFPNTEKAVRWLKSFNS